MATATAPVSAAADAPAAPSAPASGKKRIVIGAFAGLLLGSAVGAVLIAPKMGGAPAPVVEPEHVEPSLPAAVHEIENLVVNPANTNGARFLLVTTAIVVKDAGTITELAARDAEIRDRIVDLLSGRTIEELGDPSRREALKSDLAAAIGALFPEGVVKRVLLPQFVIQ